MILSIFNHSQWTVILVLIGLCTHSLAPHLLKLAFSLSHLAARGCGRVLLVQALGEQTLVLPLVLFLSRGSSVVGIRAKRALLDACRGRRLGLFPEAEQEPDQAGLVSQLRPIQGGKGEAYFFLSFLSSAEEPLNLSAPPGRYE